METGFLSLTDSALLKTRPTGDRGGSQAEAAEDACPFKDQLQHHSQSLSCARLANGEQKNNSVSAPEQNGELMKVALADLHSSETQQELKKTLSGSCPFHNGSPTTSLYETLDHKDQVEPKLPPPHGELIPYIQYSWKAHILPKKELIADLLYDNLFLAHPTYRKLFGGVSGENMAIQKRKLMKMFSNIIKNAHRLEDLKSEMRELGSRHVVYGVEDSYYGSVGTSLIESLMKALGDEFNADAQAAWAAIFWILVSEMLNGSVEFRAQLKREKEKANAGCVVKCKLWLRGILKRTPSKSPPKSPSIVTVVKSNSI